MIQTTGAAGPARAGDAIHPVLREVGLGDSETMGQSGLFKKRIIQSQHYDLV